jgi:hypothetical protein
MGLADIVDISQTQDVDQTGALETVFDIQFTTEETSGIKTITVTEEEFSPEVARERAAERARELDASIGGGPDGE